MSFERKLSKNLWFLSVKLSFERRRIFTCACCLSDLQQITSEKWIGFLFSEAHLQAQKKSNLIYLFLTNSNIYNMKSWLLIFKLNFDLNIDLNESSRVFKTMLFCQVFTISWLFFAWNFVIRSNHFVIRSVWNFSESKVFNWSEYHL